MSKRVQNLVKDFQKLGGNKIFKCPSCPARYPRDDGGASNIFLRYLTVLKLDQDSAASAAIDSSSSSSSDDEQIAYSSDAELTDPFAD